MLLLLGVVLGAACMRSAQAPHRAGTLAPGGERRGHVDDGVFRVVFAGPEGESTGASEINIVFSRALRGLDVEAPLPPVSITPPIAGKWLWVGGRALRFVPELTRLPNATEFVVEVPASVRAQDGQTLREPYRFSFTSPRPKLVRAEPAQGSDGLVPQTTFELYFNQAIDPVAIERHGKLNAQRGRAKAVELAFKVARRDPATPKRVTLTPLRPLPLDSQITFVLDAALTSEEGKLPAGQAQDLRVSTYAPLRVTELTCYAQTIDGSCAPGSSLSLNFNNAVRWSDVKKAVQLAPSPGLRWASWQEGEELTRWVTVSAPFKPASSYTLRVDGGLKDEHGQTLGTAFSQKMRFGDFAPELEIGIEGEALEAARARPIPVGYRNLGGFELVKAKLDLAALGTFERKGDAFDALRAIPGASYEKVSSTAPKNQLGQRDVDPGQLLGPGGRGVFAIAARYRPLSEQLSQSRVVKLSDLAISGKVSRFGSLFWVTKLESGTPVPGATVELYPGGTGDKGGKRYQADSSGLVHVPATDFAPDLGYEEQNHDLIVARSGADWTFERVSSHLSPWQMPVAVDLSGRLDTYGLLFTERGIYRPGDEVAIKGIARDETPTGNAVPKGRRYDVVLEVEGENLEQKSVTTSDYGTFYAKFKIPASAKLGSYHLKAQSPGKTGELSAYFEVAEYRPAEFEVSVEPRQRELLRGENAKFEVRGDYLYGAPMAAAKVTYSMGREPARAALAGYEGFATDARSYYADLSDAALNAGALRDGEGVLGPDGSLEIAQQLELPGQRYPERVALSVEVVDVTRQASAAESSILVHPGSYYVALKAPEDYFFTAPKALRIDVLALSPKSERLAGKRVELELVRRRWTLSRQDLGKGETHAVSKVVDDVVSRCSLVTQIGAQSCELKAQDSGYYLVVARAKDEKKRGVEASLPLYGLGAGSFSWGDNDRAQVELVANKKQYRVGDKAQILVKNPFKEAEALVTVERAGVYHAERIKLRGATPTITVPITPELSPNAFVSVHLIVPRGAGKENVSGPSFRYGYAELPIDPEARRLGVKVKPLQPNLLPGQEAEVELAVSDRNGKGTRAELAVYAVDEGVLMLTGYRTPDPVPVFGAARPLSVATLETRQGLAKIRLTAFDLLGQDKGAEGGGGGFGDARRDFRQVALFEPKLVTDEQGKAKVRFKLPETLTSYRVMAVAVAGDDRYGFGDARVTASKPLMVRPALPRFLRAGDQFSAAAIVAAKGIKPGKVNVKVKVSGGVLEGPAERQIELGQDGSQEVRFAVRAERVGTLKIAFAAQSAAARDSVELERTVKVPATLESVAVYGETRESASEKLGSLAALRDDSGGLEVALASSALIGVDSGLSDLVDYPYGCTEQLTSRLLPLGPLLELAKAFALPMPRNPELVRDRTVAQILARQLGDGGFAMWPESKTSSEWVTPYTLWVLNETRKSGARVPAAALDRGREYLRRWLGANIDKQQEVAAFAVDVLAMLGAPDHGYAEKLWQRRGELPVFSRGLLLHALVAGKAPAPMRKTLARELENALRISGNTAKFVENVGNEYAELMDSPVRTTAIVLRGLLSERPEHPLGSQLARGLLQARERGHWRSTQETSFSLIALDAYRRAQESPSPEFEATAKHGERALLTLVAEGRGLHAKRTEVEMSRLLQNPQSPLALEKTGNGTLYYELRLKYAPRTLPAKALDAGFFVRKALRAVKPAELSAAFAVVPEAGSMRFSAGDLIIADLVVVVPTPANYVVLDDPLPAGFEAIDANLKTSASWLDAAGSVAEPCPGCEPDREDAVAHGRAYQSAWQRSELRDDRALFFVDHMPAGMYHFRYLARATTPGSFVVPPTKVFEMYEPETFGRSAAALIEVR